MYDSYSLKTCCYLSLVKSENWQQNMALFFRNAPLPEALEDVNNGLTAIARRVLKQLYEDWLILIQQTEEIEGTLKSHSWQTAQWQQQWR